MGKASLPCQPVSPVDENHRRTMKSILKIDWFFAVITNSNWLKVLDMQAYRDYSQTKTFVTPNDIENTRLIQMFVIVNICGSIFCYPEFLFWADRRPSHDGKTKYDLLQYWSAAKMWNLPGEVVIKYPAWILWILWCRNKTILVQDKLFQFKKRPFSHISRG